MRKPVVIAIGIGLLIGISGFMLYVVTKKSEAPAQTTEKVETSVKLLEWKDPAGFSFQYEEGITIDKHDEDEKNYAHVEMTHSAYPGKLIVLAKDTTAADVAAWVKTEKTFRDGSIVDTTLGGQPAKKILFSTPTNKIIIGTIFDELLWYVEVEPGEGDYWQKTFDTIVQSFTFTPLPVESDSSGYDNVAVDEEEVIE